MKGKLYTITKCSDEIGVRNAKGETSMFPVDKFISLLPSITAFHGAKLTKEETLKSLSDEDLAEVLRKFNLIRPYVAPSEPGKPAKAPTDRSVQRYLAAYKEEEAISGNGLLGLIPRTSERGSTESVYPEATMAVMHRVIVKVYLRAHPRPTMKEAHEHFERLAKRLKLGKVPSYKTFTRGCDEWSQAERDYKRWGSRIAQLSAVPSAVRSVLGSPHGERPFTVAHCDHTLKDLALAHPNSERELLKAVHTPMVDATTDRVIAWVTRYEAPSTETIIELITDCVRRHHVIPTMIIVDWGPDFRSTWLQKTLGSIFRTTIIYRPKAIAAAGSPVEGKFGVQDRLSTHRMEGSTEIMKRARHTTSAVLPNKHTLWTLKDLQEHFETYYTAFNSAPYGTKKQSPIEREQELTKIFGSHPRQVIPQELIERALLPFVDEITRVVDKRCRISVNRSYYASKQLDPVRGEDVDVRHKPGDPTAVYVSHPKLKGLVKVPVVSYDLKYATTTAEAVEASALKNLKSPEADARKEKIWSDNAQDRTDKEQAIKARNRKAAKAQSSPPPAGDPDAPGNLVEFPYSQGGLTNLRSMEGDK